MSFELIPYTDIKNLLSLSGATIGSYPSLSVILLRVQNLFEIYTGRKFERMERTEEIFVGDVKTRMFYLPGIPVVEVSSVTLSSSRFGTETLTSSDYDITKYGIKTFFNVENCKVTIVYTGGLETVTEDIKSAALYQVSYEFQSKDQIGATSVSTEGGSVYRPEVGLLTDTKMMLQGSIHPLNMGAY